ncbi:MAG: preprotein translocase subunit SecA, partial [Thermoleophilia bacterium]
MAHFLDKLLGDPNAKTIKRLRGIVDQINALEAALEQLSDADLLARSKKLRERIQTELGYADLLKEKKELPKVTPDLKKQEQAVLDAAAPEAFALVREGAKRTLGQRHFDVQLIAGLVLHEGNITEQRTGEGKTLSATTAVYLNALVGRGSHVITVNDYLARRDAGWMGQIYDFLGLSVSVITHDQSFKFSREALKAENEGEAPANEDPSDANNPADNMVACSRQEAYRSDITYGTNNEFGFDYLRDNMAPAPIYLRQRPLYFAVVDEVDSILIDEARTPLIISAPAEESGDDYAKFAQLVPRLHPTDYTVDEKDRAVSLTDEGMAKMARWLNVENIYEDANIMLVHHLEEALKAQYLFILDKDYVVREGEVLIVDQFTGRLMPGRRYSEGLHQAIEAKEGVHVQRESDTLATISFQNFFRLYSKLSGMTGTAKTEEEEFLKLYDMEVIVVPTHRDMIRKDHADMVYVDEAAKFDAIIETIKERREKQQPLLIGTISVAKNEHLSKQLGKAGIPHEILNAKNHEKEAAIISKAGMP